MNFLKHKLLPGSLMFLLLNLTPVHAQEDIDSAESSFKYIANILRTFQTTGRLANNPGIDGAELELFIKLLENFYLQFTSEFNRDSPACTFYMDPVNGRMTIEDRAELSFSFLRNLTDRNARFVSIDKEFQQEIELEFGSLLLNNIKNAKAGSISNQSLPSTNLEQAAIINFLDTACI